jgi:hypothetical protein
MKLKRLNQDGFLPLLIIILLIVLAAVYLVFTRVLHAKGSL